MSSAPITWAGTQCTHGGQTRCFNFSCVHQALVRNQSGWLGETSMSMACKRVVLNAWLGGSKRWESTRTMEKSMTMELAEPVWTAQPWEPSREEREKYHAKGTRATKTSNVKGVTHKLNMNKHFWLALT
eukprot:355391-Amphidinium_carterae.1